MLSYFVHYRMNQNEVCLIWGKYMNIREYKYDNIRFVLITLVVFGHLLEISNVIPYGQVLYKIIYTFHMPAFIFLSGLFSSFKKEKIIFKLFIPYIIMQCAYMLFHNWLTDSNTEISFTTPYWILWYIFAIIIYTCLIPMYNTTSVQKCFYILFFATMLALFAGYENTVGYYLSLSRIIVFQPFFLLGFYCKKFNWLDRMAGLAHSHFFAVTVPSCVIFIIMLFFLYKNEVPSSAFYCSLSYSILECGIEIRVAIMIAAFCAIILILCVSEKYLNYKIPIITVIGQNTWGVYLFHGFIMRLFQYKLPASIDTFSFVLLLFGILLVFGNPVFGKIVDLVLCASWFRRKSNAI